MLHFKQLAPAIQLAMRRCRGDWHRMWSDYDFCEVCPLLDFCVVQEKEMKETEATNATG